MMNAIDNAVHSFHTKSCSLNRFAMNNMCKEYNQLGQFSRKLLYNFPVDFVKDMLD